MPEAILPHALLTPAEMAEADRAAIAAGRSGIGLMEAAGAAVARAACRFRPCRALVLAGPGNNGGDGYVAARLLEGRGWPVTVAAFGPPRPGSDAAVAASRWGGPVVAPTPALAARAGLVIDAVFGAGLSRALDPEVEAVLRAVRAPLLAVDVPSGVDGANGAVRGFAPQAAVTVTFFRRKPGHLLLPGRDLCGEVVLADIGLPDAVLGPIAPRTFENWPGENRPGENRPGENRPGLWRLPALTAESHKYRRGHLTIVGSDGMTGAARLVAGAARRAGVGLATIAAPDAAAAAVYRNDLPGTIVVEEGIGELLADERRHAWVIGPGLPPAPATRAALRQLVEAGRAVVADAGALTACAGDPAGLRGVAIATPHAGEFARVFGEAGEDRLAAARRAAAAFGGVLVLKGPDTVIAAPDGRAAINADAPPSLATAGTGDVLAGIAGSLLAQGMPPFEAAAAAVWLHGAAARRCDQHGMLAEDVIGALPGALAAAV
ncbi:NAD(P)H-hydrate dehydratase [Roseomonas sp. NAR14]|uniref:Bifunctional NAD(P)H-hydrate repair enzyme n=1 Tax=Roseomonas acroporae TaxID=2937791 RepID=A0A9X1Y772_9PROT|nr:NAD(P)H-hydrate dehydratase [Roseomonas acroporae]MCK8785244.1 NAD(P)H-hydrate dehydratase [Roseomonas acroporae]